MSYQITNTLKTYLLTGLVALVTAMPLGNAQSAFAETTMDTNIIMFIDTNGNLSNESLMFNNVLNVFTAAFIASGGDLEIVVIDENTVCISATTSSESCSSDENHLLSRYLSTEGSE